MKSKYILGRATGRNLRITFAIIDSGAVYSACLLVGLIVSSPIPVDVENIVQSAIATSAGIFPTLIIVLVGLGKPAEPTTLATNGVFASHGRTANAVEFTSHRDMGIQTHSIGMSRGDVEPGLEPRFAPDASDQSIQAAEEKGTDSVCPPKHKLAYLSAKFVTFFLF